MRHTVAMALVLVGCAEKGDYVTAPFSPPGTDTGITPTGPTTPTTGTTPTGTTTPTTPTTPGVTAPPLLPQAALDDLGAGIDDVLAGAAATYGVYVVDLDNGQVVYANQEDLPLKPASNTKLYTSALAMDALGPDHRFEVSAWSPALPDGTGAIGDLDLLGLHDPTWSADFYADAYVPADRLAALLYDAGVRRVNGTLTVHGEYVVDGYQFATYDAAWHRGEALAAIESALAFAGITVVGPTTTASDFTPGGVLLASRSSPSLATTVHPMNVVSHNEYADALARHNGYELWGASTYADGEAAMLDWFAGLGLDPTPLVFLDGSGLSHSNRVTARSTVELIAAMDQRPAGDAWRRTFSIGGVTGTLAGRMLGSDTAGRFFGKSGTLNGVICTSGILFHAHDGHRYAISVLMNDTQLADSTTRAVQDDVIEVVASDWRGGGARPSAPVLRSVTNPGDGTLVARWDAATGADRYVVWVRTDGVWRRDQARATTATELVIGGLATNRDHEVRITAEGAGGLSEPSDTYGARTGALADVLVVDGDDRWDGQWENPLGEGQAYAAVTARALGGRAHETVANEAVIAGEVALDDYAAVVWVLGEESATDLTFDADERDLVDAYLAAGGNLLVSGSEIGWDLDWLGDAAMQGFYADALHATYVADDSGTKSVVPVAGGLFDGIGELGFYTPAELDVGYPDVIAPVGGATAELAYLDGIGGTAAISYAGAHRVVHLGFPFESIDNAPQREAVMDAVLGFFGL